MWQKSKNECPYSGGILIKKVNIIIIIIISSSSSSSSSSCCIYSFSVFTSALADGLSLKFE